MCLNVAVSELKILSYEESPGFWCCTSFILFSFRGLSVFLYYKSLHYVVWIIAFFVGYWGRVLNRIVSKSSFYLIIKTHLDFCSAGMKVLP